MTLEPWVNSLMRPDRPFFAGSSNGLGNAIVNIPLKVALMGEQ